MVPGLNVYTGLCKVQENRFKNGYQAGQRKQWKARQQTLNDVCLPQFSLQFINRQPAISNLLRASCDIFITEAIRPGQQEGLLENKVNISSTGIVYSISLFGVWFRLAVYRVKYTTELQVIYLESDCCVHSQTLKCKNLWSNSKFISFDQLIAKVQWLHLHNVNRSLACVITIVLEVFVGVVSVTCSYAHFSILLANTKLDYS